MVPGIALSLLTDDRGDARTLFSELISADRSRLEGWQICKCIVVSYIVWDAQINNGSIDVAAVMINYLITAIRCSCTVLHNLRKLGFYGDHVFYSFISFSSSYKLNFYSDF